MSALLLFNYAETKVICIINVHTHYLGMYLHMNGDIVGKWGRFVPEVAFEFLSKSRALEI